MENYSKPHLQRYVVRILWMVPIYSLNSWLALKFRQHRMWFDLPRECYESYVIYNFFMYLVNFLEEEYGDVVQLLQTKPQQPQVFPMNLCLRPWPMGEHFLVMCKRGILNYVILRPTGTILAFVTALGGAYEEGKIAADNSYIYLAMVNNFSQCWALYCLLLVYLAFHHDLAPIKPFLKFACIKAVVFFSFWQGFAIAVLIKVGVLEPEDDWLQDLAICIEMFFASYLLCVAFPSKEYEDGQKRLLTDKMEHIFNIDDVIEDVKDQMADQTREALGAVVGAGVAVVGAGKTIGKGVVAVGSSVASLGGSVVGLATGRGGGEGEDGTDTELGRYDKLESFRTPAGESSHRPRTDPDA